jgi:hypothetical protein
MYYINSKKCCLTINVPVFKFSSCHEDMGVLVLNNTHWLGGRVGSTAAEYSAEESTRQEMHA